MMRKWPLIGLTVTVILLALFAIAMAFVAGSFTPEDFPEKPLEAKIAFLALSLVMASVSLFFSALAGMEKKLRHQLGIRIRPPG